MSPVAVTFRRTVGRLRSQFPTALAAWLFMSAVAALFSLRLEAAEGTSASVVALWALSASALLPIASAFIAMDVWSDERRTGRIDLLLSVAVRERDFVVGKFLGVVENSFLQHGRRHAEVNLVYAMKAAKGVLPNRVRSRENWISFEWCLPKAFAAAGLLPETIRPMTAKVCR